MAFLFRPTIPSGGLDDLSLPADPSPAPQIPRQNSQLEASVAEPAAPDEATLQDFLLKNFLTEESISEPSPAGISDVKAEFPEPADFDAALAGITHTSPPNLTTHHTNNQTTDALFYSNVDPDVETNVDTNILSDLANPEGPKVEPIEWALEETLANHKEWLDARGEAGKRADLRKAKLEGAELIGVNLRHSDLQEANLKAADLLLADLRDACMVRCNLQETCLVGANLEGANLEGASLESAMGMLPRQLAGTNLHEASLPAQIAEFNALPTFLAASKTVARLFATLMFASFVSFVVILSTKDIQLLSDSAIIRFLHSPAAATALPTDEIYLLAPALLVALYLFFLYRLQELWDAVLELPAVFPDGRMLGHRGPRIVTGLLRTHFRWMDQHGHSTRMIEKIFAVVLAYWLVPLMLLMFWARYLTAQEFHGTLLHQVLLLISVGAAFYCSTQIGRPSDKWATEEKPTPPILEKLKSLRLVTVLATLFVAMSLLAAGIIAGVPHDKQRAPQFMSVDPRRWASAVMWLVGYDPYAELTEASMSQRPANWTGADDQVSSVKGAQLNETKFRYAQAYEIFLVNARLFKANLQGAFLSGGDLRNADLGQANLKFAILDRANLQHANLDRAQLDGANCSRTDFRGANLSYSSLIDASLPDARLDGASLYSTNLANASLLRGNLEKSDMREARLTNANLEGADLQQSYLWSAKLSGANLRKAQLATAIFIDADLQNADLSGAQLNGTVLNGANLQGAILDGADLRGALQLSAAQICSTKSRNGVLLDDALHAQVYAQCGGAPPQPAPPQLTQ